MLIITRNVGTTLHIDHDITITVLGIVKNQVRLGIEAPKNVSVYREEIYLQKKLKQMQLENELIVQEEEEQH